MILRIFEELANNSSINKKKEILKSYKDNNTFKEVLIQALSPRIKFYIKKIPEFNPSGSLTIEEILPKLSKFSSREKTGNDAITYLQNLLNETNFRDAQVLIKIIEKDLKCGVNSSLVNATLGNIIPETPYMGASGYNIKNLDKMLAKGKIFSEVKMDGQYANCIVRNGEVYLESRGGNPTVLGNIFNSLSLINEDIVLNGELIIQGVDRYTSNGMINSIVTTFKKMNEGKSVSKEIQNFESRHKVRFDDVIDDIRYIVWDIIYYDSYINGSETSPRYERLEKVKKICSFLNSKGVSLIKPIEYRLCETKEEVFSHFRELLYKNQEGTIVKEYSAPWEDGKPKTQMKFKLEMDLELIVTGFNEGTKGTKFEGKYSSIRVETSDGLLVTNPAGINEETVDFITENFESINGSLVTIRCSGLSKDSTGKYSLLHPRFVCFRDDKINADSLEEAIKKEKSIKGLK